MWRELEERIVRICLILLLCWPFNLLRSDLHLLWPYTHCLVSSAPLGDTQNPNTHSNNIHPTLKSQNNLPPSPSSSYLPNKELLYTNKKAVNQLSTGITGPYYQTQKGEVWQLSPACPSAKYPVTEPKLFPIYMLLSHVANSTIVFIPSQQKNTPPPIPSPQLQYV